MVGGPIAHLDALHFDDCEDNGRFASHLIAVDYEGEAGTAE